MDAGTNKLSKVSLRKEKEKESETVYQDKTVKYKQYNFSELCIACGFLELDCSHSLADIFLLETDLPKTMNNQCFFNCCIRERPIT